MSNFTMYLLKQGYDIIMQWNEVLGFLNLSKPEAPTVKSSKTGKLIDLILAVRQDLRKQKAWALSDKIRDGLNELGISIEDSNGETKWSIK